MTGPHSTTAQTDAANAFNIADAAFDAEALLAHALHQKQWQLPAPWREGVLANLHRVHGMIAELDALPVQAGGLAKP
jgi:hypothetical protein